MDNILISSPVGVMFVLVFVAAFWFWVEHTTSWKVFSLFPPLLFIYATPVILNNTGVIPSESMVYSGMRDYALPMFIVLMLLQVNVPAAAMSLEGIVAFSCVALTYVLGRSAPFQRTFELSMKFEPVATSVRSVPPTLVLELGLLLESTGAGLAAVTSTVALVRKLRAMTREFQSGVEEMVREAELDDIKREIDSATSPDIGRRIENMVDPTGAVSKTLTLDDPETVTNFEIGNSYPTTDERTWSSYTLALGNNAGACAYPDWVDYTVGYDELTDSPEHLMIRGPGPLCRDELYFSFSAEQFLRGYISELAKCVDVEFGNKLLLEYYGLVPKLSLDGSFNPTAAGAALSTVSQPTSDLTQEYLDQVYIHLIYNRASEPDSAGWVTLADGGPIFTLMLGMEAGQAILTNNSDFRTDLSRHSSMQNELFRRLGANTVIKGFRHIKTPVPPRFNWVGGALTRVNTYANVAGQKGTYQALNPAWIAHASAPYEAAFILSPDVCQWDWVAPQQTWAGQTFQPRWLVQTPGLTRETRGGRKR